MADLEFGTQFLKTSMIIASMRSNYKTLFQMWLGIKDTICLLLQVSVRISRF